VFITRVSIFFRNGGPEIGKCLAVLLEHIKAVGIAGNDRIADLAAIAEPIDKDERHLVINQDVEFHTWSGATLGIERSPIADPGCSSGSRLRRIVWTWSFCSPSLSLQFRAAIIAIVNSFAVSVASLHKARGDVPCGLSRAQPIDIFARARWIDRAAFEQAAKRGFGELGQLPQGAPAPREFVELSRSGDIEAIRINR
jgi:hypothetical protein